MLLLDASSYLWQESIACILHIFESEINNNLKALLEFKDKNNKSEKTLQDCVYHNMKSIINQ